MPDGASSAPVLVPATSVPISGDTGDIVNLGTKVYVSNSALLNCVDVATGARCNGWPVGGRALGYGNLVRSHDASGAVDGICTVYSNMQCVLDADPTTVVTTNVDWNYTETTYSSSVEAEAGTRTFWASNNTTGLGCFDWSTMALCTGPAFDSYGFSHNDIGGNGPRRRRMAS